MAPQQVPERAAIVTRIRGEFNEMPGLCLTFQQAQRLWALDGTTPRPPAGRGSRFLGQPEQVLEYPR